jgi:putative hydrolase of the HAD superfamily
MAAISALFFDVGGVILTNAWDHAQREQALAHFGLDLNEFRDRHDMLVSSFERGKITLEEYLDRTIFYRSRPFTRDAFRDYMYTLSQPDHDALAVVKALADSGKFLMSTLNNESKALNSYRIQTFGLCGIFSLFVSSCFVGLRKPDEEIYQLALRLRQRRPEECCFIDDRPLNLETAAKLGMHTVNFKSAAQLKDELGKLGVGA